MYLNNLHQLPSFPCALFFYTYNPAPSLAFPPLLLQWVTVNTNRLRQYSKIIRHLPEKVSADVN